MKTYPITIVAACALAISCGKDGAPSEESTAPSGIDSLGSGGTDGTGGTSNGETGNSNTNPSTNPSTSPPETDTMDSNSGETSPIFDVGEGGYCQNKPAGVFCAEENRVAITCGEDNAQLSQDNCVPGTCVEDIGCVVCLDGQFDCHGDRIMECDVSGGAPHAWAEIGMCDPAVGERCNAATGMCEPTMPVGDITPTGVYFQFANLTTSNSPFLGGYDVDSIGDKIYTLATSAQSIDEYTVQLLDSDGDGQLEPNQHPLNMDDLGPIEERVLTFVQSIPMPVAGQASTTELYALDDRIFIGGEQLSEHVFATGVTTTVSARPAWFNRFSHIAFDEVNNVWYASSESARRVMSFNSTTMTWGIMFDYPELAGSHMDGMEVVTDPVTGIPYVYVSDMTSNFIAQYRKDPDMGWVQENLFSYEEAAGGEGQAVEGMGFGALNHFWATAGTAVYELGGGDLTIFTEPPG